MNPFIYLCFFRFDFVSDMPNIVQFDVNSSPALIVYGVKNNKQNDKLSPIIFYNSIKN